MKALIREPNHNVILRSDNVALRFFREYGGTPLEWWSEPFPLLTNPFAGSGVSVAWNNGQDPTQASANGLAKHPITVFSDPVKTAKFNYYCHEYLFDTTNSRYGVTGFLPDFWLSHEWNDDAIAPNPDMSDHGWRTHYAPANLTQALFSPSCPVIFQGTKTNWSGLFFVGNEMDLTSTWNNRLRKYAGGKIAFKLNLSLSGSDANSFGGVLFRKSIPNGNLVSKHEAFAASGIHLYFYRSGDWSLLKMNNGNTTKIASGKLSRTHRSKLVQLTGLQIEVRTHNHIKDQLELYIEDTFIGSYLVSGVYGDNACLFASTHSGHIRFGDRQFFDLNVIFKSLYTALDNGKIISETSMECITDQVISFYRANLPGVFLNQQTFASHNRKTLGYKNGHWETIRGVYSCYDYESWWAGNNEGTAGIKATIQELLVNDAKAVGAHLLIEPHAVNDEFVFMINPFSYEENFKPKAVKRVSAKILWETKL